MGRRQQKSRTQTGRLRIVAGIWRSRLLEIADVEGLRPTSERIRETLFNWLAPRIEGARCLDLFAGTGALGVEALSRGADRVVFVERSGVAVHQLQANLQLLGTDRATVHHMEAQDFLQTAGEKRFDIVFLDPPFAADQLEETCRLLDDRHRLTGGALVYLEMARSSDHPDLPAGWQTLKDKTAGNVRYMLVETDG